MIDLENRRPINASRAAQTNKAVTGAQAGNSFFIPDEPERTGVIKKESAACNTCVAHDSGEAKCGWTVHPGDTGAMAAGEQWVMHDPQGTKRAPAGFPTAPQCEVCGGHETDNHWWYNIKSYTVRCRECQETHWWADGYEITDSGIPYCWSQEHTREQRIAERERNFLRKHQRFALARPDIARVLPDYDQEMARLNAIIGDGD